MTIFRVQTVSVGYWRGKPHRWQNVLHYNGSANPTQLEANLDVIMGVYSDLSLKTYDGGVASVKIYNADVGGQPQASRTYFPWDTPASWVPFTGAAWSSITANPQPAGEAAALLTVQAGLGKTGKPVFLRQYLHAVPGTGGESDAQQIPPAVVTALQTTFDTLQTLTAGGAQLVLSTPSGGSVAGSSVAQPFYVAHQRTRGRRVTIKQLQARLRRAANVQDVEASVPVEAA